MVSRNEAVVRMKITRLLEAVGWRFFDDHDGPANIILELHSKIQKSELDALGANFEGAKNGFIDFLLLNEKGFPFIVLEAKAEDKEPLAAKEQARKYARAQNCRFVILSNGNLHYFWDLERGNPYVITSFPTPKSVIGYEKVTPEPKRLIEERIDDDYIALTQKPNYQSNAKQDRPMNILKFIILCLIISIQTAAAQDNRANAKLRNAEAVEQIKQLEDALNQASLKGDAAAIERMTADDYTFITLKGQFRTEGEIVKGFASGAFKYQFRTISDLNIRVYGDTAVVTGRSVQKGVEKGKDYRGDYWFTRVYVRQNGNWMTG